jgi:hypothetical protein
VGLLRLHQLPLLFQFEIGLYQQSRNEPSKPTCLQLPKLLGVILLSCSK